MYRPLLSLVLLATAANASGGDQAKEPGAMLREGTWADGVGAYGIPEALTSVKPSSWPKDGWYSLTVHATSIESKLILSTSRAAPAFLQSIITQIENPESAPVEAQTESSSVSQEAPNKIYLRVPGSRLREGVIPTYVFKNGTSILRPKLDYRYELELDGQSFAFVVRNGFRGKNGASYGDGAQYTIEYGGSTYEYSIGQFGWDSSITSIADLDGDRKPDFVITVGGSNSGVEAILLSSQAKPGRNPTTASLFQSGC